ncbi:MAG: OmpA family protein [Geothrix sp.]|nr:OmpA family protein [Geothrix sp.]
MKTAKASGMLRLLALSIIASPFAMAQESGWYVGANVGQSRAKIDDQGIINGLLAGGLTTTSISDRDSNLGYKLFGGYQMNKYFALEGGYFDLGKFGFTAATLPAGTLNGDIKLKGLNFDLVFSLPFTERFSAFARAGVIHAEAKDSFTGTGAVTVLNPTPSKRDTNYKFGVGLQYDFTRSFGVRAEVERYRINDAVNSKGDIDLASVGVLFRFGRKAPAPTPPPAPEPVAQAAAPEVYVAPVVVAPPPVKTQEYCAILDLTFEIDEADLQRDDSEKLAVVGTFLTKYPQTTAVIEGHTDNVGPVEHNMKLSLERAESVVAYLVDKTHIDRSRLKAVGYGDSRPVADNSTEEGKRANRRINAVVPCVTDIEGLRVVPSRVTMALEIEFDAKSAEVLPKHREDLRKVANFLKANASVNATVEGHTGNLQATPELAMDMSKRRAENVVNYLVDNFGIERSRLSPEGFGRTRQIAYNATAEGQAENRRVNIIITYPKKK